MTSGGKGHGDRPLVCCDRSPPRPSAGGARPIAGRGRWPTWRNDQTYLAWEQGRPEQWTDIFVRLIYEAQIPVSTDWLLRGRGAMLLSSKTVKRILERDGEKPTAH